MLRQNHHNWTLELPEGKIADVQNSVKYFRSTQANGNYKEAARK